MTIEVVGLTGSAITPMLPAVAGLRIAVFRAWPYLYDGTMAYEAEYLAKFAAAPGATIIAAYDGGELIGCATGAPLAGVEADFSTPLRKAGWDIAQLFYCGESVLLPRYRGQGLGHAFFDRREAHACALGPFTRSTFCAVARPPDHPMRPPAYVPLDAFWEKRGYAKLPDVVAHFAWKDVDQAQETTKPMHFWMKAL